LRLPVLITVSSTAGIAGMQFCSAYAAAKFGVEGWIDALAQEVADFGIGSMLVEPGFVRTDLLSAGSTTYASCAVEDYAERTKGTVAAWRGMDGKQGGDPVKLAALDTPPQRFAGGADAVQAFESNAQQLLDQTAAHRALWSSLDH